MVGLRPNIRRGFVRFIQAVVSMDIKWLKKEASWLEYLLLCGE